MRASLTSLFLAAAFAASADAQVYINELLYDAVGTDSGKTFVELYGPAGLDLSGWELRSIEGDNNVTPGLGCGNINQTGLVTLPAGSIIKPDGLLVVADATSGVTQVVCDPAHNGGVPDVLIENLDFENGPEEALQLMLGGVTIDAVQMSGSGVPFCVLDVIGQPMGFGPPALDVFGGFSLERWPAGANTGNNGADFHVQGNPSPGASKRPAGLVFDVSSISAATGGSFNLNANFANSPGAQYIVLASITAPTGSDPLGVPFDPITNAFITLATTPNPIVVNFAGTLDGSSKAVATFNLPPGLITLPGSIPFYFVGLSPVTLNGTKTNVVTITFAP